MRHEIKIDEPYLEAKLSGDKLFEIRLNDRGYQKGDLVIYKKYLGMKATEYTFQITYVTGYMQKENYVVFGEKYIGTVG